ncbi:flagellar motor protein [Celerinatantimonas sp. YJH-8]|uniref:flagellar motor protein n=1 Tax=Celerinatantimonas sp. YJH-8 TaxID=3228714 RepID=UPI0038BFDD18
MDKLTLIGLLLAFGSLVAGQWLSGGSLLILFNVHAFIIVVGGTLGAVMIQSSWHHFIAAWQHLGWVFKPPKYEFALSARQLRQWGTQVRQQGFLSLEDAYGDEVDDFCRRGLGLLIDGIEPAMMQELLEQQMDLEQEQLESQARIFESMGGYSPTIGILGAVLGLIQAMAYLATPEQLGNGIAVAFVSTIYGVGFANFVYLPIANKLRQINSQQMVYQEMVLSGLIAIAQGESSLSLERRLSSFSSGFRL